MSFPKRFAKFCGGLFIAFSTACLLTLWAHLLVCAGLHPETMSAVDTAAPLLGVLCGALWRGYSDKDTRRGGKSGFSLAAACVAFWFIAWWFVSSRFDLALFCKDTLGALTAGHIATWLAALGCGYLGGLCGAWFKGLIPRPRPVPGLALAASAIFLASIMVFSTPPSGDGQPHSLAQGMTLTSYGPDAEGTQVRLLEFDLTAAPFKFRLYDADSDDAVPVDDNNATWLGQSIIQICDKLIARSSSKPVCIINGGFFGSHGLWVANHIAPEVIDGKRLYDSSEVKDAWPEQAWVLGITQSSGTPEFSLLPQGSFAELNSFDTALAGIRPLRVDGQSLPLKPGMGGTGMRCSRTSVAWSADSKRFYVLSVRDPDAEAASKAQYTAKTPQTGGWDLRQIQQFWEKKNVPYAALFDGGESTQLAYRTAQGDYRYGYCAFHLSRTLGHWRGRPLRIYVPILPGTTSCGGVLNYFYVESPS